MSEKTITESATPSNLSEDSVFRTIWRFAKTILPWVITILIFGYIFIYEADFIEVLTAFRLVRLEIFIPAILFVYGVWHFLGTFIYQCSFNWLAAKTGFVELLLARGASYIVAMLHGNLEMGAMGYWLSRKKGVSGGQAAAPFFS